MQSTYIGEEYMTDLQFISYKESRDKLEDTLKREIDLLQGKCDVLEKEIARMRVSQGMDSSNEQFKLFVELLHQTLKISFEAGKPPEEILFIMEELMKRTERKDINQSAQRST